jgi:hypothetical protein
MTILLVTRRARKNSGREETFVLIKGALADYPVETREDALSGTLRGGNFRDTAVSIIRYRAVHEEADNREYFLELGQATLPEVARQIEARKLTPKFAKDWGVVMMCHGFIGAHILDDSDGLSHIRAGSLSAQARYREPQKKWVARQILGFMKPGPRRLRRKEADARLASEIRQLIETGNFPDGFDEEWFKHIMDNGALRDAFSQKRLTKAQLLELADQPSDDIPRINFSR